MRPTRLLPLLALGLAVSACGGTKNRGLESVHQPVVSRTNYVYDVAATGGPLTADEENRLSEWFRSMKLGYGDRIAVDSPDRYSDGSVKEAVAAIAATYGLLIEETAPVTPGGVPAGSVRVVVSRSDATVPSCPDWSRLAQPEFNANTMSNFGCATNTNLAAMIANPEDLLQGATSGGQADEVTASKAIKTYRARPAREFRSESTVKSGG